MKTRYCYFLLLLASAAFCMASSCGKTHESEKPQLSGGKGGEASITVRPKHHASSILGCRVYLKYAANEFSADTANYDEIITAPAGQDSVIFTQLKAGAYYLYGYGYDPAISMPVFGGIPYYISEEKYYSVSLPVTEGD